MEIICMDGGRHKEIKLLNVMYIHQTKIQMLIAQTFIIFQMISFYI